MMNDESILQFENLTVKKKINWEFSLKPVVQKSILTTKIFPVYFKNNTLLLVKIIFIHLQLTFSVYEYI